MSATDALDRTAYALHDARVRVCAAAELLVEVRAGGDPRAIERLMGQLAVAVAGSLSAEAAHRAELERRGLRV